jgi:CHAD domain-containing protein
LFERVAVAARVDDEDFSEMLTHLATQRDKAVASAQALLSTESFQRLLFEFAAWLEAGEWLNRKGDTGGNQPLLPFAARVLSRRRRKLRRVDDRLADLPHAVLHRLRIDAKKLRYASSFFVSLFPAKANASLRSSFAKALARLQDNLGVLNDMAVAAAGRETLFAELEPITAAKQAAQLGGLLEAQDKSRRKLLKEAERSLAEIAKAPAWWKAG